MPTVKLHERHPQAIFARPDDQFVDLFKTHLSRLEKIEGVPTKQFIEKALNADKEFAAKPGDDDTKQNKLDTMKMIYSPDRFLMSKLYREDNLEILINPTKLTAFVDQVLNGERPLYWESEKEKKEKFSQKLVGEDFEKRVIDSDKDALVLIYHPITEKNRGLKQKFEQFAKQKLKDSVLIARYNGVNESQVYKNPQKLPAIVLFKRQADGSFKQQVEYSNTREHMLKTSTEKDFNKAMEEFLSSHLKNI